MTAKETTGLFSSKPTDRTATIRCANCGETFSSLADYKRHQWTDHGGEPDLGEVFG